MPFMIDSEKVVYIKYPFPFVTAKEITDYDTVLSKQYSDAMGQSVFDKGKRVLFGCSIARQHGCRYVISFDSDDLVSDRLSDL